MNARELMTRHVLTVPANAAVREIARLLLEHAVSAVPVVDKTGMPIGMVSEGDLISRTDSDREKRRDWWLTLLAEGEELNPEFLSNLRRIDKTAQDVMSAPLVTAAEETDARELARMLQAHRIKRVPILRDGRLVGIVSRADLLHAVAEG